eukprot:1194417-Prorocentrum_minimum.AAC.1
MQVPSTVDGVGVLWGRLGSTGVYGDLRGGSLWTVWGSAGDGSYVGWTVEGLMWGARGQHGSPCGR